MAKKKRKLFSFRAVLSVLTVILVGYVIYQNWPDILDTLNHLSETNVFVLLILIPEQLFMYYACGQIFFSYLNSHGSVQKFTRAEKLRISTELNFVNHAIPAGGVGGLAYLRHRRSVEKISNKEILLISTELNFVNHAIPAGGIGGLAYLTYRLMPYNVSAGQASFLYVFRYAVTTVINYLQALVAIGVLLILNMVPDEAMWIIPVSLLMNMGVFFFLWFVVYVASSKKRIDFFARNVSRVMNFVVRVVTFGHKKRLMRYDKISNYFSDIHESVKIAKGNKKYLKSPAMWGLIYSLCEIGTYWIVAISLDRPELLPFIMVGEAIGSVFDGIVPYGLYELGMAGVMIALGVDFPTATIITVMTRVITLLFTIVSGSVPYYKVIRGKNGPKQ